MTTHYPGSRVEELRAGMVELAARSWAASVAPHDGVAAVTLRAPEVHEIAQALLAILDLHVADADGRCVECADADLSGEWRGDPWPCRTVVALLGMVAP